MRTMPARIWVGARRSETDTGKVWQQSWVLKGHSHWRDVSRGMGWALWGWGATPFWNPCSDDWKVCHHFGHCVGILQILRSRHSLMTPCWALVWVLQILIPKFGLTDWCIILAWFLPLWWLLLLLLPCQTDNLDESKFKNMEGVKSPCAWVQWSV